MNLSVKTPKQQAARLALGLGIAFAPINYVETAGNFISGDTSIATSMAFADRGGNMGGGTGGGGNSGGGNSGGGNSGGGNDNSGQAGGGASPTGSCGGCDGGDTPSDNRNDNDGSDPEPEVCKLTVTNINNSIADGRMYFGRSFSVAVSMPLAQSGNLVVGQTLTVHGEETRNALTCLQEVAPKMEIQMFRFCGDPTRADAISNGLFGLGAFHHTVLLPETPNCRGGNTNTTTTTPVRTSNTPAQTVTVPVVTYYPNAVSGLASCYREGQEFVNDLNVSRLHPTFLNQNGMTSPRVPADMKATDCTTAILHKGTEMCSSEMGNVSVAETFFATGACPRQEEEVSTPVVEAPVAETPVVETPSQDMTVTTNRECRALQATDNLTVTFGENASMFAASSVVTYNTGDVFAADCGDAGKFVKISDNQWASAEEATITKTPTPCRSVENMCTSAGFSAPRP